MKTYTIKSEQGVVALVKAANKANALRHVAEKYFRADVASADDAIAATKAGIEVETAAVKATAAAPAAVESAATGTPE